ncbi:MAG: hypothetical protein WBB06_12570, partial [Chitinophagaceae bacterium]
MPVSLAFLLLLAIYIKKSKRKFNNISTYLNLLFLLMILLDLGVLLVKIKKRKTPKLLEFPSEMIQCDSCAKPDIYLIIADEYAGKTELQDLFSFNNTNFENNLKTRGFYVVKGSTSNYNRTVYSMASLLNMNYLDNLKSNILNNTDLDYCSDLINKNSVISFFKKMGYKIYNFSPFDLTGNPKLTKSAFLPESK